MIMGRIRSVVEFLQDRSKKNLVITQQKPNNSDVLQLQETWYAKLFA